MGDSTEASLSYLRRAQLAEVFFAVRFFAGLRAVRGAAAFTDFVLLFAFEALFFFAAMISLRVVRLWRVKRKYNRDPRRATTTASSHALLRREPTERR